MGGSGRRRDQHRLDAWALSGNRAFAAGTVYVNGAYEQRPFAAYGANYDRLVEIKTAYDPTNFFRHNQNIRPKGQAA